MSKVWRIVDRFGWIWWLALWMFAMLAALDIGMDFIAHIHGS